MTNEGTARAVPAVTPISTKQRKGFCASNSGTILGRFQRRLNAEADELWNEFHRRDAGRQRASPVPAMTRKIEGAVFSHRATIATTITTVSKSRSV
jgi:hypothetical protein